MDQSMHELSSVRSLRQAVSLFARRDSPRVFVGATVATAAARGALGRWGKRDAAAVSAVVASRPVAEWLIHRFVLHARPALVHDHVVDLGAAHRRHHRDPADVDFVLVAPRYARQYVVLWAGIAGALAVARPGRRRRLRPALSGLTAAYASLVAYEWTHFLIHTAWRPRHRWLRQRRAQHRRHHFRNEHYWFGVTTSAGDHLFRTAPSPASVAPSATARTLGVAP